MVRHVFLLLSHKGWVWSSRRSRPVGGETGAAQISAMSSVLRSAQYVSRFPTRTVARSLGR